MEQVSSDCTIILGGGLSGLTVALELARRGRQVFLLESGTEVGGLARTVAYGGFRFDLGGHRFHSLWPHVTTWVRDLLNDDLLRVVRRSRIYLNGRYVNYPLQVPNVLTALSPPKAAQVLSTYLIARLRRSGNGADVSFEDWVVRRFGQALFDIYFRPYTEKVWGMDCTQLSADWASQRIRLPSLAAVISGSLFRFREPPATLVSRFLYPPLGIGVISQRLAEEALATGNATVCLDSPVLMLEHDDSNDAWRVHFRDRDRDRVVVGRQVVSTIPLDRLVEMLPSTGAGPPVVDDRLTYRSLMCIFLAVDGSPISADTWTYFPDSHLLVGRTHEPANWSAEMAPPGKTSLCVEVFCTVGDDVWKRRDEELISHVLTDLDRLGFLSRERVLDSWLLRVPCAYPVYRVGYRAAVDRVRGYLARWPSLHLAGRTGSFQYLNMDGVIEQALRLVEKLAGPA